MPLGTGSGSWRAGIGLCRMEGIPSEDAFQSDSTVINLVDYWSFPSVNSVETDTK
jgi:hypothetical protein